MGVQASGSYSSYLPANAVDKNTSTMWNSGGFAPKWIYFDLGTVRPISEVRVLAGSGQPAGTTYYDIQVSDDAVTWTNIGKGSCVVWKWGSTQVSTTARYVRLNITSHSGGSWIALFDVQIF